jgi:hypothetical protein
VKDKSPNKALWWLGQTEAKLDSVVSIDNKLNHEFSTYLSCVPNQKAAAALVPTRLEAKLTKEQDQPHARQKEIQELQKSSQQVALQSNPKPLAGEKPENPFNPDKVSFNHSPFHYHLRASHYYYLLTNRHH